MERWLIVLALLIGAVAPTCGCANVESGAIAVNICQGHLMSVCEHASKCLGIPQEGCVKRLISQGVCDFVTWGEAEHIRLCALKIRNMSCEELVAAVNCQKEVCW